MWPVKRCSVPLPIDVGNSEMKCPVIDQHLYGIANGVFHALQIVVEKRDVRWRRLPRRLFGDSAFDDAACLKDLERTIAFIGWEELKSISGAG